MIRLLRNTRLWMKGAALLLVTLAALGATSWIARDSLTTLHDGLDSLFEHSMPKMDELMALNDEVKEVHIELFRTLSWAMAGLEGAVMDAQYGRAAEEVAALKQRISAHVAGRSSIIARCRSITTRTMKSHRITRPRSASMTSTAGVCGKKLVTMTKITVEMSKISSP